MIDHGPMDRRQFLQLAASAGAVSLIDRSLAWSSTVEQFSLEITPVTVELAPGVVVQTTGYNGKAPGPILRMREGVPVTVSVVNKTASAESVHWHGLHIGALADGAMEEGSPMIAPGAKVEYRFTPAPSGTRWYHTHTMALTDLNRATYSGQFGFLLVEPRSQPGDYDQEVFLAVHHWEPSFVPAQEQSESCPEITYRYASFNDKLLSTAEPLRVRAGQRVLFHFLNASATEDVWLSLPGHRFTVLALDGNAVPNPAKVEVLSLGVAERIDAIVEMDAPGNWVLGSLDATERDRGLGIRVEYANHQGAAVWNPPQVVDWSYARFSMPQPKKPGSEETPIETLEMLFEKNSDAPGSIDRWTINGRSYPDIEPVYLREGQRYRMRMMNATGCAHPVHLHRHSFELKRVDQVPVSGIFKDTVRLERYNVIEADLLANNPGNSLFHCHQQLHMDYGFMQLLRYGNSGRRIAADNI
ncbi:Multicopper oxidase [Acidisarcina polymorpha]|uniref:Multicopper oxidase n=1 Tax=Acidisarcina polymorpha TaxID=2211140 RepID=A0A2Z5G689_9BACT|nr:multicopper oxidase domain-containing protein [Acidisarcina polymorpha]AXC14145.1 Multicopper oxidase [Acidisarcina polymorpha]